ncbi:MAG: hypothetical protein GX996_00475 [Firmicutes bacterium]|nr:hypothetical protein [Bacillota bacterium]
MVSKTMQHTKTLLKGIDALLIFLWPVNVAAEEISNLPVYVNIHQDALDSYAEYFLSSDMSAERIEAARLSALMYLQAGRKALRAKQKMMDRFGGKGLLDLDLEQYDEKIAQFALSAPATENDSTDDKSSRVARLKELFRKVQRTSSVDIFDSLNNQEKRNLNIFLSNFSEAGLPYYNAYQKHTAANSLHLLCFMSMHYYFNIHDPAEYVNIELHGEKYLGTSLAGISDRLNRFFYGLNCTPEFVNAAYEVSGGLTLDGKYALRVLADGAQLNKFSQAKDLVENKDGTLKVQIDIYDWIGDDFLHYDSIHSWVYDPISTWSKANKANVIKTGTAVATLVRYKHRGKPSYQLVEYEILTQTQKNQKD